MLYFSIDKLFKSVHEQSISNFLYDDFYINDTDLRNIKFENIQSDNSEFNLLDPKFSIDSLSNKNLKFTFIKEILIWL